MCKEDGSQCWCCCKVGPQGVPGQNGSQGIQGQTGIQGQEGPPGPKGECPHCCDIAYFNVYSNQEQLIAAYSLPNDAVLFSTMNAFTPDFDFSNFASTGEIVFLKHGVYHISWHVEGRINPPFPEPVPSFSFGLWLDSVLVGGSVASGYTQSPNDDATPVSQEVSIEVLSGSKLILRNACVNSVSLNPNVTGSVFPITAASINCQLLKAIA